MEPSAREQSHLIGRLQGRASHHLQDWHYHLIIITSVSASQSSCNTHSVCSVSTLQKGPYIGKYSIISFSTVPPAKLLGPGLHIILPKTVKSVEIIDQIDAKMHHRRFF